MGLFASVLHILDVAQEGTAGVQAARAVLEAGGSPLAAFDAFAAATGTTLDDQAAAEVRAFLVLALQRSDDVLGVLLWVSEHLSDPQVKAQLDTAVRTLGDLGFHLVGLRSTVRQWLADPAPG